MVTTFWQPLLRSKTHQQQNFNGYANAASYALGAAALLGLCRVPGMSHRGNRWWISFLSLLLNGGFVYCMGRAVRTWQLYVGYIALQVVFRVSTAVAMLQVGSEVCERAALEGMDGVPKSAQPRLAMVFSITELLGSCVQASVETLFKYASNGSGGKLGLSTRFELLGAGVAGIALLLLVGRLIEGAVRRLM